MRKILSRFTVALLAIVLLAPACKKQVKDAPVVEIPQSVIDRVAELGFATGGIVKDGDGYIVEGDIRLSNEDLSKGIATSKELVYANEEHYRTTNTVTGLPRTINVSLTSGAPTYFSTALNTAISRYNALNLQLRFARVTSGGNIRIVTYYQVSNTLGSSGFPSGGNPYPTVNMNTYWYSASTNTNYLASIIAHEIGHCIGFRHTDYMNRAYSCGGSAYNEGSAGVGAIWINGTPTGASANSWMLACSNGSDRPFTTADQTALTTLY